MIVAKYMYQCKYFREYENEILNREKYFVMHKTFLRSLFVLTCFTGRKNNRNFTEKSGQQFARTVPYQGKYGIPVPLFRGLVVTFLWTVRNIDTEVPYTFRTPTFCIFL
jgi:hypothetical protein